MFMKTSTACLNPLFNNAAMHEQMTRLYEALRAAGLSTSLIDVAQSMDERSSQTVKNWEYRGISQRGLNKAQSLLGINSQWLETGAGPMFHAADAAARHAQEGRPAYLTENVAIAPARGRVPIISWVQAGSFTDVQDFYEPGEAEEWATAFDSAPSRNAFALRVEGDSMTAPSGRSFPHGCIIIVEPNRSPKPGDFIVAKDISTQRATFKQLASDGMVHYLKPLNSIYQTQVIDDNKVRIIGVVIEWFMGGKL